MKKLLITTLILLMLILTACGSAASGSQPETALATEAPAEVATMNPPAPGADSGNLPGPPVNSQGTLSVQAQLIIGIYKMDGTAQAITPEQAAALIPLWLSLQEALANTSSAQDQVESLTAQIKAVLTPEQVQAITEMNLTQDDVQAFMQEQGLALGGQQRGSGNGPQQGNPPQVTPPAGGPPGGNQPPAGQRGTPQGGSPQMGFNFVPPELIDAFLQFLQAKASS
jgi:hypothetical protein